MGFHTVLFAEELYGVPWGPTLFCLLRSCMGFHTVLFAEELYGVPHCFVC